MNGEVTMDTTLQTLKAVTGSLAHELRTPLAGIGLAVQLATKTIHALIDYYEKSATRKTANTVLSQENINYLKSTLPMIHQQVKSAEMTLNLHLQRVGKRSYDERLFSEQSITAVIERALKCYPFLPNQQGLVHWSTDNDFHFWGEPNLMMNVLYNLIDNALHFIKKAKKGEIFISLEQGVEANYFYFRDTAMGMPPNVVPKIFEEFYSLTQGGTGLGLSTCRAVMHAFKGDITCESEENVHTLFILTFPKISEDKRHAI